MLEDSGYFVAITERWNPFAKIRHDLFGFVDLLAIKKDETLAVQTTSYSNISARVKKIESHENVSVVRSANWSIHVHGWKKNKFGKWECKIVDVS